LGCLQNGQAVERNGIRHRAAHAVMLSPLGERDALIVAEQRLIFAETLALAHLFRRFVLHEHRHILYFLAHPFRKLLIPFLDQSLKFSLFHDEHYTKTKTAATMAVFV